MSPRPNAPWPYYEDEPPTHRCPICDWLLEGDEECPWCAP